MQVLEENTFTYTIQQFLQECNTIHLVQVKAQALTCIFLKNKIIQTKVALSLNNKKITNETLMI